MYLLFEFWICGSLCNLASKHPHIELQVQSNSGCLTNAIQHWRFEVEQEDHGFSDRRAYDLKSSKGPAQSEIPLSERHRGAFGGWSSNFHPITISRTLV
jgi:hypothetical protein